MLPPHLEETVLPDESPLAPPPAPRSIDSGYARHLLKSDGVAITAGVFILLGIIFSIVGVILFVTVVAALIGIPFIGVSVVFLAAGILMMIWRHQKAEMTINVLRTGEPVLGRITRISEDLTVSIGNRHPWLIKYQFQLDGRTYQGQVSTFEMPGPRHQVNKDIYVLYLPGAPKHHTIYPHP